MSTGTNQGKIYVDADRTIYDQVGMHSLKQLAKSEKFKKPPLPRTINRTLGDAGESLISHNLIREVPKDNKTGETDIWKALINQQAEAT